MRRPALIAGVAAGSAAVAVAAVAAWWFGGGAGGGDEVRLRPDDARLVARGAEVYAQHCAACHGERLQGQPNWRDRGADGLLPAPPHDPSGHTWHHPDALLFRITKHGFGNLTGTPDYRTAMPVYAGVLSDEDIVAVLSWIKSRWPAEVRAEHDRINDAWRQAQRER